MPPLIDAAATTPSAKAPAANHRHFTALDTWIDAHFDEEVALLQGLVRIPTDTPPGNNAPHAEHVAAYLKTLGWSVEAHAVPTELAKSHGLNSVTNLIVRRSYADGGPVVALNAHGDVVPPGDGWTHPPYGAEIRDGRMFGRATAVSKSDFASYIFAVRALEALGAPLKGGVELHFTYDEEFGGLLGPGWLFEHGLTKPDFAIAAGFSYHIVTAHNACLQFEVTVHGTATHGAMPETGHDAMAAASRILAAIYANVEQIKSIRSGVSGIGHPTMLVGTIEGGTNTNVVAGKVVLRMDRRMIPEEDPVAVEAQVRAMIESAVAGLPGIRVDVRRLLLARAMRPLPGHEKLVAALQRHGAAVLGETPTAGGTPLYTDARIYAEHGVPIVLYGAGPRSVPESNAKRADENLLLDDLRKATKVVARTLFEFTGRAL